MKNLLNAMFHKSSRRHNASSACAYTVYEVRTKDCSYGAVSLLSPEEVCANGLPSKSIVGIVPENSSEIVEENFRPNPEFVKFLHYVIEKFCPEIQEFQAEAKRQGDGWVYIIDSRANDPYGEVDAEDIVGAFQVENGAVVLNSYEPNEKFRLISKRGLFCLDFRLQEKLLEELRQSSN